MFRIKVENAYGISDPSEESQAFDVGGVQIQDTRYNTECENYSHSFLSFKKIILLACFRPIFQKTFLFLTIQ